jgi:hypothetical protein
MVATSFARVLLVPAPFRDLPLFLDRFVAIVVSSSCPKVALERKVRKSRRYGTRAASEIALDGAAGASRAMK